MANFIFLYLICVMNYMTAKEADNGGKEYKFRIVQRVK